jgi:hypothetical protein
MHLVTAKCKSSKCQDPHLRATATPTKKTTLEWRPNARSFATIKRLSTRKAKNETPKNPIL